MRPIDAEALKEHKFLSPQVKVIGGRRCGKIRESIIEAYQKGWNDCIDAIIDNAPTIEPICPYLSDNEVKQPCIEAPCEKPQGEWIVEDWTKIIECNLCHGQAPICITSGEQYESNFCPICGADMRGGEKS